MKLQMRALDGIGSLFSEKWRRVVMGASSDDRGSTFREEAMRTCADCIELLYEDQTHRYRLAGSYYHVDELEPLVKLLDVDSTLVDATTLGFVEVLLCVRAAQQRPGKELFISYVEPISYSGSRSRGVLHSRDFALSDRSGIFSGVPGSLTLLNSGDRHRAVFMVGYEGERLQKALEQNPIEADMCNMVFGVPAFQAGWEMNTFDNIVSEMDDRRITSALFAGAANPLAAMRALERVYETCAPGERMVIFPIGTKPHGIGAALYSVRRPEVGLVYDYPVKLAGRSSSIGRLHLFTVYF